MFLPPWPACATGWPPPWHVSRCCAGPTFPQGVILQVSGTQHSTTSAHLLPVLFAGARICSMLAWRGPATPWALLLLAVWQSRPWRVGGATTWQIWCCTLVRCFCVCACVCVAKVAADVQTGIGTHTHVLSKGSGSLGRFCRTAWFLWQTFLMPHNGWCVHRSQGVCWLPARGHPGCDCAAAGQCWRAGGGD